MYSCTRLLHLHAYQCRRSKPRNYTSRAPVELYGELLTGVRTSAQADRCDDSYVNETIRWSWSARTGPLPYVCIRASRYRFLERAVLPRISTLLSRGSKSPLGVKYSCVARQQFAILRHAAPVPMEGSQLTPCMGARGAWLPGGGPPTFHPTSRSAVIVAPPYTPRRCRSRCGKGSCRSVVASSGAQGQ